LGTVEKRLGLHLREEGRANDSTHVIMVLMGDENKTGKPERLLHLIVPLLGIGDLRSGHLPITACIDDNPAAPIAHLKHWKGDID
jgi:hypothetical protein